MKTKTRFAKRLVIAMFALLVAQSALAFYNPSTGRWLSRDPIEEAGSVVATKSEFSEKDAGPNHYAFIANAPVNEVDYVGLYRFLGRHSIEVGPCEIVFVYGHGSQKPRNWKWKFKEGSCSAGAAIVCWPVLNSDGIPDGQNLWTTWGGEPVDDYQILWGMPVNGPDWYTWGGELHRKANANKALWMTFMQAVMRSVEICKRCPDCKNVRISFIEIDRKGDRINPVREYDGVPPMSDVTIPCDICRTRL